MYCARDGAKPFTCILSLSLPKIPQGTRRKELRLRGVKSLPGVIEIVAELGHSLGLSPVFLLLYHDTHPVYLQVMPSLPLVCISTL